MSKSMLANYNKWKRGDDKWTKTIIEDVIICTRVYERKLRFRTRCERERVKLTSAQKRRSGNDSLRKHIDRKRKDEWWRLAHLSLFWILWQPIIYPSQREGIDDIEPGLLHCTVRTRTSVQYFNYSYTVQKPVLVYSTISDRTLYGMSSAYCTITSTCTLCQLHTVQGRTRTLDTKSVTPILYSISAAHCTVGIRISRMHTAQYVVLLVRNTPLHRGPLPWA